MTLAQRLSGLFIAFAAILFMAMPASAATRFWVGGTGSWDGSDTTHWSATTGGSTGASVPTSGDTVTFDSNSGTAATVTVTAPATSASLTLNKSDLNLTLASSLTVTGGLTNTAGTFTHGNQTVTMNAATCTITGTWVFYNLTRTPTTPAKTDGLTLASNITVANLFTISDGATVTNRVLLSSSVVGTPRTITAAACSWASVDVRDIALAGAATPYDASGITGKSGDEGGNSGITFTAPATQHWTNASSGSWSASGNWTSRVPLPQDPVVMDKAFGTSQTVTADMPRLGASVDWTGATWTTGLTWAMSTGTDINGSLTMISGLTVSGTSTYTFTGRGSYTLDSKGINLNRGISVWAPGGTLTLAGDLTIPASSQLSVRFGSTFSCVNGGSNYALSVGSVQTAETGTVLTLGSATHLITGTASPTWNFSGSGPSLTATTGTIKFTDTSNTAINFTGGARTYGAVWFARGASTGSITIVNSNTFTDFKDTGTAAHSHIFTAGTTQTLVTYTVSGTAGNVVTLDSSTTGTYSLVKTGAGKISSDYLSIQHCLATPGHTWFAGTHSTNNQATATAGSGWIFTVVPTAQVKKVNGVDRSTGVSKQNGLDDYKIDKRNAL